MIPKIEDLLRTRHKNQKVNYDDLMRNVLEAWQREGKRPKILVHSCCAPCSTWVIETLSSYADIAIFYSNSNIHPRSEYIRRSLVQKDFIASYNEKNGTQILYLEDEYKPEVFYKQVAEDHLEKEPEGGRRCELCFTMRLDAVAHKAFDLGYDYFASALTLSPHKNSELINQLGFEVNMLYDTAYLPSDFKKKGGYQRSIQMAKEYELYRQCYCGCIFSAQEHEVNLIEVNQEARHWIEAYYQDKEKKDESIHD